MKQLMTLLICAFFAVSTFAQEKKEPTKKETFDFIITKISETIDYCGNADGTFKNIEEAGGFGTKISSYSVKDYDFENLFVEYQTDESIQSINGNKTYHTNYNSFSLEDLKSSILLQKNKLNIVLIKFKKLFFSKNVRNNEVIRTMELNSLEFVFDDALTAKRMNKALNHLIKLNGGSNSTLFDD